MTDTNKRKHREKRVLTMEKRAGETECREKSVGEVSLTDGE